MFDSLSFKARRWLAVLVLVIGMPVYIVLAVTAVNWLEALVGRLPLLIELVVYVALGMIWILPFKGLFKGIGKPDPDAEPIKWDDEI
ncbi:DUF2842 domain-containing protein [uncultured Lentibacter sp.]|jgi:hypothetical protein|uniref:DUF2842 domain-containing protein n=1 Tax=uncultured Lentibacter sp. TaxID=1659309 RepID=UPI00260A9088|nr:DUF2842 domain-containing protein [uncultured Lentibacter sp.]